MLEIYTDASVSKGNAVATVFIISSELFIGYDSYEYKGVNSSLQGELLGLKDGISFALQNNPNNSPMKVYCDSISALNLITKKSIKGKSKQFKHLVQDIESLCAGHPVEFSLIKGHQVEHNPNKVVDLISNSVLRYSMREE